MHNCRILVDAGLASKSLPLAAVAWEPEPIHQTADEAAGELRYVGPKAVPTFWLAATPDDPADSADADTSPEFPTKSAYPSASAVSTGVDVGGNGAGGEAAVEVEAGRVESLPEPPESRDDGRDVDHEGFLASTMADEQAGGGA